jgi:hypothetical protein
MSWPTWRFETALRASADDRWKTSADRLVRALAARFDPLLDVPIFPADRLELGTRLDAWIVCGLALPALDAARVRGSTEAGDVVVRLRRVLLALPRPAGVVATHYVHTWRGGWSASLAPPEPCAQAWVVEGLWLDPALRHLARRQSRPALAAIPGTTWDAATRLALCLRLVWLRSPLP